MTLYNYITNPQQFSTVINFMSKQHGFEKVEKRKNKSAILELAAMV